MFRVLFLVASILSGSASVLYGDGLPEFDASKIMFPFTSVRVFSNEYYKNCKSLLIEIAKKIDPKRTIGEKDIPEWSVSFTKLLRTEVTENGMIVEEVKKGGEDTEFSVTIFRGRDVKRNELIVEFHRTKGCVVSFSYYYRTVLLEKLKEIVPFELLPSNYTKANEGATNEEPGAPIKP